MSVSPERLQRIAERRDQIEAESIDAAGLVQTFANVDWQTGTIRTESRAARIQRMESMGSIDPACAACKEFYEHSRLSPFAPRHKALPTCRSGKHNHCTCDACF